MCGLMRSTMPGPAPYLSAGIDANNLPNKMGGGLEHIMSEINKSTAITSVLREIRVFKPRKEFAEKAHIKSLAHWRKLYNESVKTPDKFWAKQAKSELVWFKPWRKVLQWKEPFAKWFVGGRLNVCYNCLDRHLGTPIANKAALMWEGEPAAPGQLGEERTLTYKQLHR